MEHDSDVAWGEEHVEDGGEQEVCIAIPPDLLEDLKKGNCTLVLEPVPGGPNGLPSEFRTISDPRIISGRRIIRATPAARIIRKTVFRIIRAAGVARNFC